MSSFIKPASSPAARGQALIEFALLAPVLLLITLGMIDFGRAYTFGVGVQQGAREAARYAIRMSVSSGTVTDARVLQRLIDASAPALQGCTATTAPQTCGGGTWTLTLAITPEGSSTTYTSIATALQNSANLSGGQIIVTAQGSVALLGGYCLGQSLCLPSIGAQGQSSMEFT